MKAVKENLFEKDKIRTFTGVYIDPFNPKKEDIVIEDIAHALSNQCRFGGHLPTFYSVAQHCVLCAESVPEELKLQALMHDASEAYLMDIPRPIKHRLNDYAKVEKKLMRQIAMKFRFDFPISKDVKEIDNQMLQLEWYEIMLQKRTINFPCWTPGYAKEMFLLRFSLYSEL